ncbi:prealbumin-like fold domain-containing protein [Streptomyces sp. NPDC001282]|uniref:prealbumin-like fold domain-containing protein n=1 Tax=Streptomyces sp. NPDC001282 TaxID=3364557 RepID=UPI0036972301
MRGRAAEAEGRVVVLDDFDQNKQAGSGGYPFDGDLPDCSGPTPVTGEVRVLKADAETGRALRGARFELWRETNGIAGLQTIGINPDIRVGPACATDPAGLCTFDDLPLGEYCLRETAVPEGHVLPTNPVFGPTR